MDDSKGYYRTLGVTDSERKLSGDEFRKLLKKKYYAISKECHPDTQNGKSDEEKTKAAERFKEVNEAYDTLSDDSKRYEYDNPRAGFEDLFGRPEQRGPMKGQSLKMMIRATMSECMEGSRKIIRFGRTVRCKTCGGDGVDHTKEIKVCHTCGGIGQIRSRVGNMFWASTCPDCGGTGKIFTPCPTCGGTGGERVDETVEIEVPKGVYDGYRYVVEGKGCESQDGGPNGDLFLMFSVNETEVTGSGKTLERDGTDIYTEVDVNYIELLKGCRKVVEVVGGKKIEIEIKECANPYGKVRVVGKGLPSISGGYGNLYCSIKLNVPKSINDKAKDLLEKLSNELYGT